MFFFEKKNQKTFARCRGLLSSDGFKRRMRSGRHVSVIGEGGVA